MEPRRSNAALSLTVSCWPDLKGPYTSHVSVAHEKSENSAAERGRTLRLAPPRQPKLDALRAPAIRRAPRAP